ncbi:hypothetical protein Goe21_02770 [Bacillus phage vB_BsuM-Goe21]|nr:hypothetical protein Goe21_02770 [Bacillus phage vB_BsuM-Goe21]
MLDNSIDERMMTAKLNISFKIKKELQKRKISIRQLAENIGLKHPQIVRITNADNYNINTLLKILDGLDLEVTIQNKNKQ